MLPTAVRQELKFVPSLGAEGLPLGTDVAGS